MAKKNKVLALSGSLILSASFLGVSSEQTQASEDQSLWTLDKQVDLSDSSKWDKETGPAKNHSGYDLPENAVNSSEGLRISGVRGKNGKEYSTGDAKGTGITIPNYAKVEATGKMPFGQGIWPAILWMRPLNSPDGEIDLVEQFGTHPQAVSTVHSEYGPTHKQFGEELDWSKIGDPEGVHRWTLEKTPNRIKVSVDDKQILEASPSTVPNGFDWKRIFENPKKKWYPRVTLQIGCGVENPNCGVKNPKESWKTSDILLQDLKIWKYSGSKTPTVGNNWNGVSTMSPGTMDRTNRPWTWAREGVAATSFILPKEGLPGTTYTSVTLNERENGKTGIFASAQLRSKGDIWLTLKNVKSGKVIDEKTEKVPGFYKGGDRVRVEVSNRSGKIGAKAWVSNKSTGPKTPQVMLNPSSSPEEGGSSMEVYLAKSSSKSLQMKWSGNSFLK